VTFPAGGSCIPSRSSARLPSQAWHGWNRDEDREITLHIRLVEDNGARGRVDEPKNGHKRH
jgi:hypothetical protein